MSILPSLHARSRRLLTSRSHQTQVVAYTSTAHALVHAVEFTYPALLLTIARELGFGHLAAGALAQAFAFTFGLSALPSGFLVDRLGGRRVMLITFAGGAVGCGLIALAPGVWALGVLLALTGLFVGLYHPAGLALIAQWSEQRALAAAYHGVAGNIGVALAPITAVTIATLVDWRAAFLFMAVLCAAVVALVAFVRLSEGVGAVPVPPAPASAVPPGARPPRTPAGLPVLFLVYGVFLLNGFIYRGSLTFLPGHIEESARVALFGLDERWLAGSLTTLALAFGAVGQLVGGALSLRVPLERLAPALTGLLLPLLLLVGFSSGGWLVLAASLFVLANFSTQPVHTALIANYSDQGALGRSYGIGFFLSFGLGSSAATIAGGIADVWDVAAVFKGMSVFAALALACALAILVSSRGRRLSPIPGRA